jgi:hypothetical protein
MSTRTDPGTFGTAKYYIVLDDYQFETPIPRAAVVGEWTHIPYSAAINKFETTGGKLHTSWRVRIELPTAADYSAMVAAYGSFRALTTPFYTGSKQALLREMPDMQRTNRGAYVGFIAFEWA